MCATPGPDCFQPPAGNVGPVVDREAGEASAADIGRHADWPGRTVAAAVRGPVGGPWQRARAAHYASYGRGRIQSPAIRLGTGLFAGSRARIRAKTKRSAPAEHARKRKPS